TSIKNVGNHFFSFNDVKPHRSSMRFVSQSGS
ncbi:MAG: hypothetical protein ACI906_002550, partial [Candidatus Latescibacterota bacterium]